MATTRSKRSSTRRTAVDRGTILAFCPEGPATHGLVFGPSGGMVPGSHVRDRQTEDDFRDNQTPISVRLAIAIAQDWFGGLFDGGDEGDASDTEDGTDPEGDDDEDPPGGGNEE